MNDILAVVGGIPVPDGLPDGFIPGNLTLLQVTGVDTTGLVTAVAVVNPGNYLTLPQLAQAMTVDLTTADAIGATFTLTPGVHPLNGNIMVAGGNGSYTITFINQLAGAAVPQLALFLLHWRYGYHTGSGPVWRRTRAWRFGRPGFR